MARRIGIAKLLIKEVIVNDAEDFSGRDAVYIQVTINGPNGRTAKKSNVLKGTNGETLTFNFRAFDQVFLEGQIFNVTINIWEEDNAFEELPAFFGAVDFKDDLIGTLKFKIICENREEADSEDFISTFADYTVTSSLKVSCLDIPDGVSEQISLDLPPQFVLDPIQGVPAGLYSPHKGRKDSSKGIAKHTKDYFDALLVNGFSEEQAIRIVASTSQTNMSSHCSAWEQ